MLGAVAQVKAFRVSAAIAVNHEVIGIHPDRAKHSVYCPVPGAKLNERLSVRHSHEIPKA